MDKDGMWLSRRWKSAEAFFRPRSLAPVLHAARSVRAAKTEDCFEQTRALKVKVTRWLFAAVIALNSSHHLKHMRRVAHTHAHKITHNKSVSTAFAHFVPNLVIWRKKKKCFFPELNLGFGPKEYHSSILCLWHRFSFSFPMWGQFVFVSCAHADGKAWKKSQLRDAMIHFKQQTSHKSVKQLENGSHFRCLQWYLGVDSSLRSGWWLWHHLILDILTWYHPASPGAGSFWLFDSWD